MYVDAALGLLAYRSLDNESIARLIDTLRVEHNLHRKEPEKSESKTDTGFTGRFVLTPEQNEILARLTTALDVPYDRQKTQYTYTVVDNFPQEDLYVISSIEAPKIVEGN